MKYKKIKKNINKYAIAPVLAGLIAYGAYSFAEIPRLNTKRISLEEITAEPQLIPEKRLEKSESYTHPKTINYQKIIRECVGIGSEIINDYLVNTIIEKESGWNARAVSKSNAIGLMGLKEIAWNQIEPKKNFYPNVFNPVENIKKGVNYLEYLEDFLEEKHPEWESLTKERKLSLILAAYNAGPTKLRKNNWEIEKMPKETINYVKDITEAVENLIVYTN